MVPIKWTVGVIHLDPLNFPGCYELNKFIRDVKCFATTYFALIMKMGGIISGQGCEQEGYPSSSGPLVLQEELHIQVQGLQGSVLQGVPFSHHDALLGAGVAWRLPKPFW